MFKFLKQLWRDEPARVVARSLALIPLIFALLTSFNITFTGEQQEAISAMLYGLAVLFGFGGEAIRQRVTPIPPDEDGHW